MGFANSFSEAFNNSYSISAKTRAAKEESEYEWRMKGIFAEKEAKTKAEAKESKAQSDARVISEMTGKPIGDVLERVRESGYDATLDWAKNTVGGSSGSVSRAQSVDDEMAGSGMAQAESPVDTLLRDDGTDDPQVAETSSTTSREAVNAPTQVNSGGYRPKPKVIDPEDQIKSLQREYSLATTSPERKQEIEQELKGFGRAKDLVDPPTPNSGMTKADLISAVARAPQGSPERQQAQAALDMYTQTEADQGLLSGGEKLGTVLDENGNRVVVPLKPIRTENGVGFVPRGESEPVQGASVMGPEELDMYKTFQKDSSKPEVLKQNERVIGVTGMLRSSARLQAIVAKDANVLQDVTGTAVDFLDSARKEFEAGTTLLGIELKKNGAGEVDGSTMDALAKKVDGIDVSAITDRAQLRDLFKAEMNLLVYRAGSALGQSGQAFSGKDFNLIAQGLKGSTDGPSFTNNLNSYMSQQIRSVEDSGQQLQDYNNQLKQFASTYGYLPVPAMPSVADFIASRMENDPELTDGYVAARSAKPYAGINDRGTSQPTPNTPDQGGWTSTPNGTKFRRVQ